MVRFPKRTFSSALAIFVFLSSASPCFSESGPSVKPIAVKTLEFPGKYIRHQEPDYMTFDELKRLSFNPNPTGGLRKKLQKFWTTPIISNEAYYGGARPHQPSHENLGPFLRVVQWNIEKSFLMPQVIKLWTSSNAVEEMIDTEKAPLGSEQYNFALYQRDRLLEADIVILEEMDVGVKRSGYLNAPGELAKALNMNYTYGTMQLEIDPAVLGTEKIYTADGAEDTEAQEFFQVDPFKYKGMFGSAVLSRYPIKNVEVFQLENHAYDWYWGEKSHPTFLESARRGGTKTLFLNEITREMKVGGRNYMRVDLDVPQIPGGTLTVINIHLEIKCLPEARDAQMAEILSYISKIHNPVIMAGDFNAAPNDLSPTSLSRVVSRTAKSPTTWFSAGVSYFTPYGMVVNPTRAISNVTKNFQNPLAAHIPVLAPNHVRKMFKRIENFRFSDGSAFDFRGNQDRSINGKTEVLANSNQRDTKGFKTTFQVRRPLGPLLGKLRLDWFFMKAYLKDPKDDDGSYVLAPHFAETLEELNTTLKQQLSDHHPSVIDLPFEVTRLD